ncbi:protein RNA-directed DNA methylation 3-like isoform X3 [Magnolia sinica]|uniref:protein RNA-directed DNA methylation 3-like isoform X3 n=1 Tax=Magnolia sinica TaxID=86752 RepID=UPI0026598E25|nr:protein RNA-directed DNA methylation 3-like isoform X3 [Magnolia sinica]
MHLIHQKKKKKEKITSCAYSCMICGYVICIVTLLMGPQQEANGCRGPPTFKCTVCYQVISCQILAEWFSFYLYVFLKKSWLQVGHEMQVAFCLIQKYVDMQSIGAKLQIISAFSVEHVKGYIYIEADRERDVVEVCKGLCSIYSSRVVLVPKNEVLYLLSLQIKSREVSKGTWVRVKYWKYKGDLAQVVAVDDARKRPP